MRRKNALIVLHATLALVLVCQVMALALCCAPTEPDPPCENSCVSLDCPEGCIPVSYILTFNCCCTMPLPYIGCCQFTCRTVACVDEFANYCGNGADAFGGARNYLERCCYSPFTPADDGRCFDSLTWEEKACSVGDPI